MKEYLFTLDTEGLWINKATSTALIYNVGWAIHDHDGNIAETRSYLIKEIFLNEVKQQTSRYYTAKIRKYLEMLGCGKVKLASIWEIHSQFAKDLRQYKVKKILAYNARYDRNSLEYTLQYISKGNYPGNWDCGILQWWDTWEMFKSSRNTQKKYCDFCENNGFKTDWGNNKTTAEIVTKNLKGLDFTEDHTALEDVFIEIEIYVHCRKMHKKMNRLIAE